MATRSAAARTSLPPTVVLPGDVRLMNLVSGVVFAGVALTLLAAGANRLARAPWVEIGSIEGGKLADFAVLDDDPTEVAPERLKDVGVWGTVHGGRVFEAASI